MERKSATLWPYGSVVGGALWSISDYVLNPHVSGQEIALDFGRGFLLTAFLYGMSHLVGKLMLGSKNH